MLGDDSQALEADLAAEFPRAELAGPDAGLRAHVAAIRRRLASGDEGGPPVDVGGTAFEQQVWRALRAIPYGEVRSYQQVAQAIGRPTAARAVAQACAANPVALVVPCHRVVRADGASGGYRWGAARKAALLEHERRGGAAGPREAPPRAERGVTNGEDRSGAIVRSMRAGASTNSSRTRQRPARGRA